MKLDNVDIPRIYENQPKYLRLYNIDTYTQKEFDYLSYMPMFVNELFISTYSEELMHKIRLQFPHVLHEAMDKDGKYKFKGERNKDVVDIDITSKCNISCNNCSRFSNLSSTWVDLPMGRIEKFIKDNAHRGRNLTVKVIGGEPTIHPHIDKIIIELDRFFHVVLVTNGVKDYTPPVDICIENSAKWIGMNPEFWSTCDAPIDDPEFEDEDFSHGCDTAHSCGSGFTVDGYFPCTIMGSIDRMVREPGGPREGLTSLGEGNLAYANTEKNKAMVMSELCKYCGFYKRMGFREAYNKEFERTTEQFYSKSWKFMEGRK